MPVQVLRSVAPLRAPRRGPRPGRLLAVLAAASAAFLPLRSAEQVVARIFEHAGRLLEEGRAELAVDEFRRLVESYPQSELADDALLAIGAQSYGVTGLDGLGRAHGAALEEAFKIFDRVRREHPQGNAAPAAVVRMAYARLEPRSASYSLDEARALFRGVSEIYPDSEWVDRARLGLGFTARRQALPARVLADLQPFAESLAASPLAPLAHLWRADAFEALGRRGRALEVYQRIREQWPRASESAWAQGRALALLRRTLAAQGAARLAEDSGFASQRIADLRQAPRAAISTHGWIYLADAGRGRILRLDPLGRLLDQRDAPEPTLLALDACGLAAIVEGDSLRVGKQVWPLRYPDGKKMVPLRPAAAPLPRPDGSWWILDERGRMVLELDRGLLFKKIVWVGEDLAADRTRMGPDGTAWLMDTGGGRLARLGTDGKGKVLDLRAAPVLLREPADLAVDAHGAVWILDAGRRGVAVFSPAAQYEGFVALEGLEGAGAQTLEVDPAGGLLVYDTRQRRLRRFRDPAPPAAAQPRAEVKP